MDLLIPEGFGLNPIHRTHHIQLSIVMFKFLKKIEEKISHYQKMRIYKKRITANMSSLEERRILSKQQRKEVQSFYQGLMGRKIPLYSHEYFYSRTGVFAKEYFPTNIYYCDLLGKANRYPYNQAYGDKNICDMLFPGENVAHTLLKNMNGYYYIEGQPVAEDDAVRYCQNIDDVMIKPSGSHSGYGVHKLVVKDGVTNIDGKRIEELFREYKEDFLIQKCIHQHADMSALNPTSVNTMRILTYRSGMEVLLIYAVIRIGRLGAVIDNQSSGGMSVAIDEQGCLGKYAAEGYATDRVEKTESGVILEGYQLPAYDKAIQMVKRLHLHLPYFNIVGWDIAIEENGEPILIEWNNKPGLSQSSFASGFGKHTERIVRELWPRQNTRYPLV